MKRFWESVNFVSSRLKRETWFCSLLSNILTAADRNLSQTSCISSVCHPPSIYLTYFTIHHFFLASPTLYLYHFLSLISFSSLTLSLYISIFLLLPAFFLSFAFLSMHCPLPLSLLPSPLFNHSMLGIPRSQAVHSQALEESIVFLSLCPLEKGKD